MNGDKARVSGEKGRPLKVLVLSRSYPNSVTDLLGLWVERLVRQSRSFCELKVVAPVPYCPPLPGLPASYARFRRVERIRLDGDVEVLHPRFVVGPGYSLHSAEWISYYAAIHRLVDRLRRNFPFDLIHAHFTYPDGVVAARLGQRYGVPVIITEHVPWGAWMDRYPRVLRRAISATRQCALHISVSESVRKSVEHFVGPAQNLVVIPNAVDGSVFKPSTIGQRRIPNQILFAGAVRPVKGVDILLKAVRLLVDRGRDVNLLLAGEAFYEGYQREEIRLRQIVRDLLLEDRVRFAGKKTPPELARCMQESGLLVLPSRAESFGVVLVEALACGTPVVATRCGGPEDIVNDRVGVLVPPENPVALADGIEHVLEHPAAYDPMGLRAHALENFGLEAISHRLARAYSDVGFRFHDHGKQKAIEGIGAEAGAQLSSSALAQDKRSLV